MAFRLRSALEFGALERKRALLNEVQDWPALVVQAVCPALVEFELSRDESAVRELKAEVLEQCVGLISSAADRPPSLAVLKQLHRLLVGCDEQFRQSAALPMVSGHEPVDPEAIPRALDRLFQWIESPAFAELHPVEKMTLCQARLYEIVPYETHAGILADLFSFLILRRGNGLLPLYRADDLPAFRDALLKSFECVTKPLADINREACERACDLVLLSAANSSERAD